LPGKTPAQVVAILQRLIVDHVNVLATRADDAVVGAVAAAGLPHVWHAVARLIVARPERREGVGLVVVAAAGTSDLPVARRRRWCARRSATASSASPTAAWPACHRLLAHRELLAEANAIIAVAGMEGALPSVIGGSSTAPSSPCHQRRLRHVAQRARRAARDAQLVRARRVRGQRRQRVWRRPPGVADQSPRREDPIARK